MKNLSRHVGFLIVAFGLGAMTAEALRAQSKPPAYYIAQIEFIGDADEFSKNYGSQVGATLAPFGGRVIVRGAKPTHLEGDVPRQRNALIKFDNIEKAFAWYNSSAYQQLISIRKQLAKTNSYLVEGFHPKPSKESMA